jgi:hypothetical protein
MFFFYFLTVNVRKNNVKNIHLEQCHHKYKIDKRIRQIASNILFNIPESLSLFLILKCVRKRAFKTPRAGL